MTANFAINTYTLTYTAGANGSITGTSPQTVNHGASGTAVTAVAGHRLSLRQLERRLHGQPAHRHQRQGQRHGDCQLRHQHLYADLHGRGQRVDQRASPQTVNYGASGTAVTAVPATGYHFVSWSDGVLTATRTDTNVTANVNATANFAINTYTLTYSAGANGSISGTTPQTVVYGGSGSAVTAVANTGYHFVSWSDGVLTATRTDANVLADITVTANFAADNFSYTLTYTAGANGSITGVSPQTVAQGADGTAVTAVPNAHYHFVNWSDASTANPRSDINVLADITVTANFAIDTFTLTYTAGANGSITGTSPQTVDYGADGAAVTAVPNRGITSSTGAMPPRPTHAPTPA